MLVKKAVVRSTMLGACALLQFACSGGDEAENVSGEGESQWSASMDTSDTERETEEGSEGRGTANSVGENESSDSPEESASNGEEWEPSNELGSSDSTESAQGESEGSSDGGELDEGEANDCDGPLAVPLTPIEGNWAAPWPVQEPEGEIECIALGGNQRFRVMAQQNDALVEIRGNANFDGMTPTYSGQAAVEGRLLLGANEVFWGRVGDGLHASGEGPELRSELLELNQNKSFAYVEGWDSTEEQIVWGLWFEKAGKAKVQVELESTAGSQVDIRLGSQRSRCTTVNTEGSPRAQWEMEFDVPKKGAYLLSLQASSVSGSEIGKIHKVRVAGSSASTAYVLRSRWRPLAAHSSLKAPDVFEGSPTTWVVEYQAVGRQTETHYSPLTTPFGYYGVTWSAQGLPGGINFSLWSYGDGEPEPQDKSVLSHLLAVGSPDAIFGRFDHEGHGVKIRNWNPIAEITDIRLALALRSVVDKDPRGRGRTTYFSYFLDSSGDWKLLGAGRKMGIAPIKKHVGSFVEVPGVSSIARTGAVPREVRYRGWMKSDEGEWYSLDSFHGTGDSEQKAKAWYVAEDGRFAASLTGLARFTDQNKATGTHLELAEDSAHRELPLYLSCSFDQLEAMPISIGDSSVGEIDSKSATISVDIDQSLDRLSVFYGLKDHVTFGKDICTGDGRCWPSVVEVDSTASGSVDVEIPGLRANTKYYYRILAENENGRVWSWDTESFTTKN